ncbi:hypothetical protein C8J57DRAFT_1229790 [Mycena rebaudengoi]|nr:hypothetical protein C8J57DRAFT_1229790 [Mycena rebaudengoi]
MILNEGVFIRRERRGNNLVVMLHTYEKYTVSVVRLWEVPVRSGVRCAWILNIEMIGSTYVWLAGDRLTKLEFNVELVSIFRRQGGVNKLKLDVHLSIFLLNLKAESGRKEPETSTTKCLHRPLASFCTAIDRRTEPYKRECALGPTISLEATGTTTQTTHLLHRLKTVTMLTLEAKTFHRRFSQGLCERNKLPEFDTPASQDLCIPPTMRRRLPVRPPAWHGYPPRSFLPAPRADAQLLAARHPPDSVRVRVLPDDSSRSNPCAALQRAGTAPARQRGPFRRPVFARRSAPSSSRAAPFNLSPTWQKPLLDALADAARCPARDQRHHVRLASVPSSSPWPAAFIQSDVSIRPPHATMTHGLLAFVCRLIAAGPAAADNSQPRLTAGSTTRAASTVGASSVRRALPPRGARRIPGLQIALRSCGRLVFAVRCGRGRSPRVARTFSTQPRLRVGRGCCRVHFGWRVRVPARCGATSDVLCAAASGMVLVGHGVDGCGCCAWRGRRAAGLYSRAGGGAMQAAVVSGAMGCGVRRWEAEGGLCRVRFGRHAYSRRDAAENGLCTAASSNVRWRGWGCGKRRWEAEGGCCRLRVPRPAGSYSRCSSVLPQTFSASLYGALVWRMTWMRMVGEEGRGYRQRRGRKASGAYS